MLIRCHQKCGWGSAGWSWYISLGLAHQIQKAATILIVLNVWMWCLKSVMEFKVCCMTAMMLRTLMKKDGHQLLPGEDRREGQHLSSSEHFPLCLCEILLPWRNTVRSRHLWTPVAAKTQSWIKISVVLVNCVWTRLPAVFGTWHEG